MNTPDPIPTTKTEKSGKPYTPPAIIHELELETRAGSPLSPDGIDPFGFAGLDE
jgi:hypothetical protein